MSIETIGLSSISTTDTRPRDYVQKNLARQERARTDYISENIKIAERAISKRMKMEAESSADINRINRQGLRKPEPNLTYHRTIDISNPRAHESAAYRRFDTTA